MEMGSNSPQIDHHSSLDYERIASHLVVKSCTEWILICYFRLPAVAYDLAHYEQQDVFFPFYLKVLYYILERKKINTKMYWEMPILTVVG